MIRTLELRQVKNTFDGSIIRLEQKWIGWVPDPEDGSGGGFGEEWREVPTVAEGVGP